MIKAKQWSELVAQKKEELDEMSSLRPTWAFGPNFWVRVNDHGNCDIELLSASNHEILSPDNAVKLGRFLIETFGEPTDGGKFMLDLDAELARNPAMKARIEKRMMEFFGNLPAPP